MYTPKQIQQASEVPIVQYLASKGIQPVKEISGQYLYYSPFREEYTPSFFVEPTKNVFYDFGDDNGDVIRLVRRMENLSFPDAMKYLLEFNTESLIVFEEHHTIKKPINKHVLKRVTSIKSKHLIEYLEERGIPLRIANIYLYEIHYYTDKGSFFSLGFPNYSDGWELRNKNFKGCLGAKSYRFIINDKTATALFIFEGFFSFLSYIVANEKSSKLLRNYLILNSAAMLTPSLINSIVEQGYKSIYSYVDNDDTGRKLNIKMEELLKDRPVSFYKHFETKYPEYKDYNDYLVRKRK